MTYDISHSKRNLFIESRREKPIRTDFLNEAEFEEKLDKYSKVGRTSKASRAQGRHRVELRAFHHDRMRSSYCNYNMLYII